MSLDVEGVVDRTMGGNVALGLALVLQKFPEQFQCHFFIPTFLDKDVENLALTINSPPHEHPFAVDADHQASGAGELHPRALSEPDVILSHHPAPVVRPYPCSRGQWANNRGWRCAMRRSQCRDRRL
jgi:hypothetical protein